MFLVGSKLALQVSICFVGCNGLAMDSWEQVLSVLDLTEYRQELVDAGYDNFKAGFSLLDVDYSMIEPVCA